MTKIRIATRKSPLAMWQAHFVQRALQAAHADITVELLPMVSMGDKILDSPLAKIGGKGLFVKELEQALLENRADIAVHSMKDVPMQFPSGLGLSVICPREDPQDAFVSNSVARFQDLPQGATVGTSSLRRQCQLKALRPDIKIRDLRGNVNSRLSKLDDGQYDAIILATAGLLRLDMESRITQRLAAEVCLPAGGQGAVGIECRIEDGPTAALISVLHDPKTAICVIAERAMNGRLQGGCQVPIACYAQLEADSLFLRGLVGSEDGSTILRAERRVKLGSQETTVAHNNISQELGVAVAEDLISQGADKILALVYS